MSEITKDQIESWKRDSEILSEIYDSLNEVDDWSEQELFMELLDTKNVPHPSDLLYHIWRRWNPTEPRNVRVIDGRLFENPNFEEETEKDEEGRYIIRDTEGNIVDPREW